METEELKNIHSFFRFEENKYVCLISDCRSKIATLKDSALHRHFRNRHPSKLKEILPLNKSLTNLEILRKEILLICVEHVSVCGRTLNSIFDSSFQKLLKDRMKPLQGTPHELTMSEIRLQLHPMVHKIADEIREEIRVEFANKYFSVMFDTATKMNRAVLGIDIRTIHSGKVVTRSIGMQRITSKHTGKNIAEMIVNRLKKHGVSPKLMASATIDNAANMVKAVKIMDSIVSKSTAEEYSNSSSDESDIDSIEAHWLDPDFQRHLIEQATRDLCSVHKPYVYDRVECIRCAAHTIQLAIDEALEKSNFIFVVNNARKLVKNLRLQQILLKLEEKGLPIPSLDCKTRWFSIYIMLFVLLRCKQFVSDYVASKEKPAIEYSLTEVEWGVVKQIVDILEIPFRATKMLQTADFTLSDFHAEWLLMEAAIKKRVLSSVDTIDLASQLLDSLKKYSAQLLTNPMYAAAVYLDPRFTRTMDITSRKLAISKLLKIWDQANRKKDKTVQPVSIEKNNNVSRLDELEELLAEAEVSERSLVHNSQLANEFNQEKMLDILEKFADLSREKINTDVVQYWENNKDNKPELFMLSQIVYVNSPTQTNTERSFSAFNHIFGIRRSKLKPELLENILLIHLNRDLFEKVVSKHLQET